MTSARRANAVIVQASELLGPSRTSLPQRFAT